MCKVHKTLGLVLLLIFSQALPAQQGASPSNNSGIITIKGGLVTAIDDVEVPAKDPGVFGASEVQPGQSVKRLELLGKLDDTDALIRVEAAASELEVAKTQASSDAEVVAAKHTSGAALKEYEQSKAIRAKNPESISLTQLRRDELQWLRAEAQIDVAAVQLEVHRKTIIVKEAQLKAAQNEVNKRQFKSPVDGIVVEIFKNVGEFVPVGERVFRVVRMDKLRVEGFVSARDVRQESLRGRPVRVSVFIPEQQQPVQLNAKIDFASPIIEASNEYRIFCDIQNVVDDNQEWVISPGARAEIAIDLGRSLLPSAGLPRNGR